jgi:diguanylate cyclase (GGDEF)-like protein
MPGSNAFEAHSFCEQLRTAVQATTVSGGGNDVSVTISIGVVEIETGEPFGNQLQAADQLLYLAKANGRNRVYSDLTLPEAVGS